MSALGVWLMWAGLLLMGCVFALAVNVAYELIGELVRWLS